MNNDKTLRKSSREYREVEGRTSCLVTPMKLLCFLDILNVAAARIVLDVIPKKVSGIGQRSE